MPHRYKEAFSLRNDICICPNVEVERDVVDEMPLSVDDIT